MKIKNTILLGALLLLLHINAVSQNIVSAEYFWDNDPGIGNGEMIELVDSENIFSSSEFQATGLSEGLHKLHIRIKDESHVWSHYNTVLVMVKNEIIHEITKAEYFWDIDPGVGNGIAFDITSSVSPVGQLSISDNLSEGIHYLHIRVCDDQNTWSNYNRIMVIFQDNSLKEIVEMEYFWDIDPGVGNATSVDIQNGVSFDGEVTVNTDGLSLGSHNLYIRILDETNTWSHYKLIEFTLCETFGATASFDAIYSGTDIIATNTGEFATSYSWTIDNQEIGTENTITIPSPIEQELCLTASNACGTSTYCAIIGLPDFISVTPNVVPNNLVQTIECIGHGFQETANVEITKDGETIVASAVVFNSPQSLTASFNFNLETIGLWDVHVIQESTLSLSEALELTTWIGVAENRLGNTLGNPFPNPTQDEIHIPYAYSIATEVYIIITDELGKEIESRKTVLSGNGTLHFSLKNQASGIYFIQVKTMAMSKNYKVVR